MKRPTVSFSDNITMYVFFGLCIFSLATCIYDVDKIANHNQEIEFMKLKIEARQKLNCKL